MGLEMSFCESRNETKRHEPVRRVLNRFLPWDNYLFFLGTSGQKYQGYERAGSQRGEPVRAVESQFLK